MAKNEHSIEDIFREALSSHEMDVSPKVWSGIETTLGQAGAAAGSAASGSAFLAKAAAVVGFAGLITAATIAEIDYQTRLNEVTTVTTEQVDAQPTEVPTKQNAVDVESTTPVEEPAMATAPARELQEKAEDMPAFEEAEKPSGDQRIAVSETKFDDVKGNTPPQETKPDITEPSGPVNEESDEDEATAHQPQAPAATPPSEEKNKARPSEERVEEEEEEKSVQASATAYFSHDANQIITPNGDGINDHLKVDGYGVDQYMLQIGTVSGHIVFETKDMNMKWTGVDRAGNALPEGVYYFRIQAVGTDGLPYMGANSKGSVTIKR